MILLWTTPAWISAEADERQRAHLIAVACTPAPEGQKHWTLPLVADQAVQGGFSDPSSHEAVRQLKKHRKTLATAGVVRSRVGADFVAPVEGVLDLYEASYDPAYTLVCFEESPKQ